MTIIVGDCRDVLATLEADSIDAIVTDPPYGIGFMGKAWDSSFESADMPMRRNPQQDAVNAGAARQGGRQRAGVDYQRRMARDSREFQAWTEAWATEAFRVLRPGGHLLSFGGTRTYHRMVCGIEDAGFEIRDQLAWLFGSGFPKSLDVSKALDKAAGAERERLPGSASGGMASFNAGNARQGYRGDAYYEDGNAPLSGDPITAEAHRWNGWGTALKPAHEPIALARKPLVGTVAANVAGHGTGALNIDACRIGFRDDADERESKDKNRHADFGSGPRENEVFGEDKRARGEHGNYDAEGRWPANVVLDEETAAMLDEQTGDLGVSSGGSGARSGLLDGDVYGSFSGENVGGNAGGLGDRGGASRFFYCAKTSRAERNAGLQGFEDAGMTDDGYGSIQTPILDRVAPRDNWTPRPVKNNHPTVKPIALMRWLTRLVTPPGGTVLDPFTGSGTTGCACALEGFEFLGVELDPEYVRIAEARIAFWAKHGDDALRIVADSERSQAEREVIAESGQLDLLG